MTEQDLQICLKAYHDQKLSKRQLGKVFDKLAEEVFVPPYRFDSPYTASVLHDAAKLCLTKIDRYDPLKAKALVYFGTIIGCSFTQDKRTWMNLQKLKKGKT